MDIKFTCPRCLQNISIDEKGAGATVECPTCKSQIRVPVEPSAKPPLSSQPQQEIEEDPLPPPLTLTAEEKKPGERRWESK